MKVMQPRTKKGPTWANEAHPQPESSPVPPQETQKEPMQDDDTGGVREEGISDLEWMRRRMKDNVDVAVKEFEQFDDEEGAEKISPTSVRVLHLYSSYS